MCHAFYRDSNFYRQLFELDQQLAELIRLQGCPCGGTLHSARYPRKPRGVSRQVLAESCDYRFSFCCSVDGCRRRCTPPSVRFLGRKVYLIVIIVLMTALEHGLSDSRRRRLIESLDVYPQTFYRLRRWWQETFAHSLCWRALRAQFQPPITPARLPGEALGQLTGTDLALRLFQWLVLLRPMTSVSCSHSVPAIIDPQKMR